MPSKRYKEVLFVLNNVAGWEHIREQTPDAIAVHVLDAGGNALEQMAEKLRGETGVDAIHYISHGDTGRVDIGNDWLSNDTLLAHRALLEQVGSSLQVGGDILLYGCNVAAGAQGQLLIDQLATITQADVAASSNLTGSSAQQGDWTLEVVSRQGLIEAQAIRADYAYTLGWFDLVKSVGNALELIKDGAVSIGKYSTAFIAAEGVKIYKEMTLGTTMFAFDVLDFVGVDNLFPGESFQEMQNFFETLDKTIEQNIEQKLMLGAANEMIAFSYLLDGIPIDEQDRIGQYDNWDQYAGNNSTAAKTLEFSTDALATLKSAVTKGMLKSVISVDNIKNGIKSGMDALSTTKTALVNSSKYLTEKPLEALKLMGKTADAILMTQSNKILSRKYLIETTEVITDIAKHGLTSKMVTDTMEALKEFKIDGVAVELMALFRTPNADSLKWILSGLCIMKPMAIKAKTTSDLDFFLNPKWFAMGTEKYNEQIKGLVGVYEPSTKIKFTEKIEDGVTIRQYETLSEADERILETVIQATGKSRGEALKELADLQASRLKEWENKNATIVGLDEEWGISDLGIVYSMKDGRKVTGDYDLYDIRLKNGQPLTDEQLQNVTEHLLARDVAVHPGVSAFGFKEFNNAHLSPEVQAQQIKALQADYKLKGIELSEASAKAEIYKKQLELKVTLLDGGKVDGDVLAIDSNGTVLKTKITSKGPGGAEILQAATTTNALTGLTELQWRETYEALKESWGLGDLAGGDDPSQPEEPGTPNTIVGPGGKIYSMEIRDVPSEKRGFPGKSQGEYANDTAFAVIRADGSVITWGTGVEGGDSSRVINQLDGSNDVVEIFSTRGSFAALRADGSVVTWGYAAYGPNGSSTVSNKLNGAIDVVKVFSTQSAFAALRADGSVVTWGYGSGDDSSKVVSQLDGSNDVVEIFSTNEAFAALRADGSVVTWGGDFYGGDSSAVSSQLDGSNDVVEIFSTNEAFAALRADGSVVTWGYGASTSAKVAGQLDGSIDVIEIFSTGSAFAALRADGSVVTWGATPYGGDSSNVANQLDGSIDVVEIFSTDSAFAALRANGSVVTWGATPYGGDSSNVANQLDGSIDVIEIFSTDSAFAALRADGSVVTWGKGTGGDSSAVANQLDGSIDVVKIFSTKYAFAALRTDGSVVTWGAKTYGGDSSNVANRLDGTIDVIEIFSSREAFAALRADGSMATWGFLGGSGFKGSISEIKQLHDVVAFADIYSSHRADTPTAPATPGTQPLLSISNLSLTEGQSGNKAANFVITLSEPASSKVTVHFRTEKGTALPGGDYLADMGSVTFAPGQTSAQVAIQVLGDTDFETDETFDLVLYKLSGAGFVGGVDTLRARATIQNDDVYTPPVVRILDAVAREGAGGSAKVVVELLQPSAKTVKVDWHTEAFWLTGDDAATLGKDFAYQSGTLSFAPGETRQTITVNVLDDSEFEINEFFHIYLDNPVNAAFSGGVSEVSNRVGIVSDDLPTDKTLPTFSQAQVVNGKIELSFNEKLSPVLPDAESFTITLIGSKASVQSISQSSNKLTIELNTPVTAQTSLKLAYRDQAGNQFFAIQDQAGNDAASFDVEITQQTPPTDSNNPAPIEDGRFTVLQTASASIVGAGPGNDVYLLSSSLIAPNQTITISDAIGNNSIQLADGLSISSSKVVNTALQLSLSNGSSVTILGADRFTYETGGNLTAGIDRADVSYADFVQNTLKSSLPLSGINQGGAVNIGTPSGPSQIMSILKIELMDLKSAAAGGDPLEDNPFLGFKFYIDGEAVQIASDAFLFSNTYSDLLRTIQQDISHNPKLAGVTAKINGSFSKLDMNAGKVLTGSIIELQSTQTLEMGNFIMNDAISSQFDFWAGYSTDVMIVGSQSANPPIAKTDDFVVLQNSSAEIVGAGIGDDTYLISDSMMPADKKITISDALGNNSIQLASGLSIASSKIANDALQLTLTNGSMITVLGASKFTYEPGGNLSAGINGPDMSYQSFVTTTLDAILPVGVPVSTGGAIVI